MPEKNTITEGRIPASETEIALSKQYFEDYPDTKIGDTLTLPVGRRMYNGESCMDTDLYHEGETFTGQSHTPSSAAWMSPPPQPSRPTPV